MLLSEISSKCSHLPPFFETFIPIVTLPKQSTRFAGGHSYVPKKLMDYVEYVSDWCKVRFNERPVIDLVGVELCFCFPYRVCDKKLADRHPFLLTNALKDLDNLKKPVFDAMSGVIFVDDRQIVYDPSTKVRTHSPGIGISVYKIKQNFR